MFVRGDDKSFCSAFIVLFASGAEALVIVDVYVTSEDNDSQAGSDSANSEQI